MSQDESLRERYLRDGIPVRLGNLASSVKRLGYFAGLNKQDAAVQHLIQECRFFSTWTAPDVNYKTKTQLETLQRDLASWEKSFLSLTGDESWRAEIAAACERWADLLLELSGLLKK